MGNLRVNIFIALSLIANGIYAHYPDSLKTIDLDEVVVTGTKINVTRSTIPYTLSVVNQKKIEESSESSLLPILTEQVPGLFVTERGISGFGVAGGAAGQISIRGIGGNPTTGVLVLLNGNPQFMGLMGHPLPDSYVASDVKRVEVIRGPASTLYGSNAMGGVINIITKEQDVEGITANAGIVYGSYNTQKYMLNGGFKKKNLAIFAGYNHDQTNGHRDSSDFRLDNGYFNVEYRLTEHIHSKIDFSLNSFKAADPGQIGEGAGYSMDIVRGMGAFSLDNAFDKLSGSVRFFYNFGDHNITDGFHSTDNNYGLILYENFNLFKENTITVGLDYKNYGGRAENTLAAGGNGVLFADTSVYEISGYSIIQQKFLKRFAVNAGFRLDYNKVFGSEPVPSAGLTYSTGFGSVAKISIAKGFRSPTIRELFLWAPANDSLQPEHMMSYEISYGQSLKGGRIKLEVAAYKEKGENLIQLVIVGGQPKNMNSGTFANWGFEFVGSAIPVKNLSFNFNYSYLSTEEPVIAAPGQKIFTGITYQVFNITFGLSLQNIMGLYTQAGDNPVNVSYNLLNSRISYKLNKVVDFYIKAENLFDEEYEINYGYPMPGVTFFGGINLHLH